MPANAAMATAANDAPPTGLGLLLLLLLPPLSLLEEEEEEEGFELEWEELVVEERRRSRCMCADDFTGCISYNSTPCGESFFATATWGDCCCCWSTWGVVAAEFEFGADGGEGAATASDSLTLFLWENEVFRI